jgi:hypothetical protein
VADADVARALDALEILPSQTVADDVPATESKP